MKCTECSKEYESKRSTSKYCSAQCRKLAFHADGKVSVLEVSVPPEPEDAPQSTNAGGVVAERTRKVAIPGDSDYVGCCKQVDGVWQVDNTKPPIEGMSDLDLQLRLKGYPGASWVGSPEHWEVARRRAVHELVDKTLTTAGVPL